MTSNEIKEECLKEAGIDLGRYSHSELTEIKDALRRYHNAKLKLLGIAVVNKNEAICNCENEHWKADEGGDWDLFLKWVES